MCGQVHRRMSWSPPCPGTHGKISLRGFFSEWRLWKHSTWKVLDLPYTWWLEPADRGLSLPGEAIICNTKCKRVWLCWRLFFLPLWHVGSWTRSPWCWVMRPIKQVIKVLWNVFGKFNLMEQSYYSMSVYFSQNPRKWKVPEYLRSNALPNLVNVLKTWGGRRQK